MKVSCHICHKQSVDIEWNWLYPILPTGWRKLEDMINATYSEYVPHSGLLCDECTDSLKQKTPTERYFAVKSRIRYLIRIEKIERKFGW